MSDQDLDELYGQPLGEGFTGMTLGGMPVVLDDRIPGIGPVPVPSIDLDQYGVNDYPVEADKPEMVNHPAHYLSSRSPKVTCPECGHRWDLECIEVIRWIRDGRLFTAMKYLWRVAFGGKFDNAEDVSKAVWYETDYLEHPIDDQG